MALPPLLRHALSMPPQVVAAKAARKLLRMIGGRLLARLLRRQTTYPPTGQAGGPLIRRVEAIDRTALEPMADWLRHGAAAALRHEFDLLGSGPVQVARSVPSDWRRAVAESHWRGNHPRSRALLGLIDDPAYRPLDWQADFRSGYRWSVRTWHSAIAYGHRAGVDIKVPWELARLQHLPVLALAFALDGDRALAGEFRNQVLDFLASNPPGWGVNWACPMDVAIRAVNLVLARDLFHAAAGAAFDTAFEDELAAALLAHGRHVATHLEWTGEHRGNHYLADIVGLVFLGAFLPRSPETDLWLGFGTRQLATEIERQFLPDGGNFEASTAYHRLSMELALWGVACVMGLGDDKRAALAEYDHTLWRRKPALEPAPVPWPPFPPAALERLARAARFTLDITKPTGDIVQVGDNDSGRLVTPSPWTPLDVRHLVAATQGLFDLELPVLPHHRVEAVLVAALGGGTRLGRFDTTPAARLDKEPPTGIATRVVRVVVAPPDGLGETLPLAYPDFGLFIWKGPRAFVSVRCGPIGQNGQGGHAHNDQLAVEIEADGVAFARDPGTFTYTADLAARNRWRSAAAHFVPRHGTDEPARFLSPFSLEDRARAEAVRFDGREFLGCHHGFGAPVWRRVMVDQSCVVVEDLWGGPLIDADTEISEHIIHTQAELASLWDLKVPFSPGYGLLETRPSQRAVGPA